MNNNKRVFFVFNKNNNKINGIKCTFEKRKRS